MDVTEGLMPGYYVCMAYIQGCIVDS